jgi:SpoVK/Ycf46/Vps4 family AAA+-type ATPase
MNPLDGLFDQVLDLPSGEAQRRLGTLIGLDDILSQLRKQAMVLVNPRPLEQWSEQFHGRVLPAVHLVCHRTPLIILAGDVGTGKTTLAETFADALARSEQMSIRVMRLSLRTRGRGESGEATDRMGKAFDVVREQTRIHQAVILVIDEADALAQSRALKAMHHEDRAGVNALIRGLDSLVAASARVLAVMCTNRLDAIDPAVRRRAAGLFILERPTEAQRHALLANALGDALKEDEIAEIARLTGPRNESGVGYTWSDLSERLIPAAVLAAYPHNALSYELLREQLTLTGPTKPFTSKDESPTRS